MIEFKNDCDCLRGLSRKAGADGRWFTQEFGFQAPRMARSVVEMCRRRHRGGLARVATVSNSSCVQAQGCILSKKFGSKTFGSKSLAIFKANNFPKKLCLCLSSSFARIVYFGCCRFWLAPCHCWQIWKQILWKKVDLGQNSAFNMYNIVFADLIETFVFPNAAYLLTLD